MKNFFKSLFVLVLLAVLPFGLLYVLELYITDFKVLQMVRTDGFQLVYIMYAIVALFFTGIDYVMSRDVKQ